MSRKIYIVRATHWYVPGEPIKACATREVANREAASIVNDLRNDLAMTHSASVTSWKKPLLDARRKRARELATKVENLGSDDADVWITELEIQY